MLARLHDPFLVLVSIGLVALLIAFARWLQRAHPLPRFQVRKLLHALVGLVTLILTVRFRSRGWALVPPALFVGLNAWPRIQAGIPELAESRKEARGLWMFPLGVCLVYLFFWDVANRGAVLAAVATLAFADPVAALAGTRFGQRRYARWAYGRTLEGSLAFFAVSCAACAWVAAVTPGGPPALRAGVGCGLIGAAAEALSPAGVDNLTIPLAVAAAYRLLI